jgi:hypothetical protein
LRVNLRGVSSEALAPRAMPWSLTTSPNRGSPPQRTREVLGRLSFGRVAALSVLADRPVVRMFRATGPPPTTTVRMPAPSITAIHNRRGNPKRSVQNSTGAHLPARPTVGAAGPGRPSRPVLWGARAACWPVDDCPMRAPRTKSLMATTHPTELPATAPDPARGRRPRIVRWKPAEATRSDPCRWRGRDDMT